MERFCNVVSVLLSWVSGREAIAMERLRTCCRSLEYELEEGGVDADVVLILDSFDFRRAVRFLKNKPGPLSVENRPRLF